MFYFVKVNLIPFEAFRSSVGALVAMLDIIDAFKIDADEGVIFPTAEVSIGTIMLLLGVAMTTSGVGDSDDDTLTNLVK